MNKSTLAFMMVLGLATLALYKMKPETAKSPEFAQFKTDFKKVYDNEMEESYRHSVFLINLAKIEAHNADPTQTHTEGVNQFTDMTQEEFIQTYLNTKVNTRYVSNVQARTMASAEVNADIDWSAKGMVSAVKNQGQCGSCWAFSATGSIESAYLQAGKTVLLSEQQLVDCSRAYGNQGCNGGWMDSAFEYIIAHGLKTESEYPYKAVDQSCAAPQGGSNFIKSYTDVPGCTNLYNALVAQPVSVAVDASNWSSYRSGILSRCGTGINHGVLLVGATDSYWKVKNSWSASWGENGFIRLNRGNTCAICGYGTTPQL